MRAGLTTRGASPACAIAAIAAQPIVPVASSTMLGAHAKRFSQAMSRPMPGASLAKRRKLRVSSTNTSSMSLETSTPTADPVVMISAPVIGRAPSSRRGPCVCPDEDRERAMRMPACGRAGAEAPDGPAIPSESPAIILDQTTRPSNH